MLGSPEGNLHARAEVELVQNVLDVRGHGPFRDHQSVWRDPASGYLRRQIFERTDHPIELVRVEPPARARVGVPASSYARIRQVVWVIEGELVIDEAGTRHELKVGDCLGFGPPADTTFANESDATCAYLVIVSRS